LGIAVATMVEADAAEALLGKTLELLDPHPRRKRHAVREEDGRALPAAHRVDAPAVVARVPPGLVEGGGQGSAAAGGRGGRGNRRASSKGGTSGLPASGSGRRRTPATTARSIA